MTRLRVEQLSVVFRRPNGGDVHAVRDVSFELADGEILGLVGESGSGKSMAMLAVLGLIREPNARITGRVLLGEQDLLALGKAELGRIRGNRIAMIFQDPMTSLNPVYRVGWQIAEQIRQHQRVGRAAAKQRAVELLRRVGIPDPAGRARDYPHQFSGGMRQRAMIAMALSCDPDVIIADEPTTALDVTVQAQILDVLADLNESLGTSIVLITHDLGVLAGFASRTAVMYAGRIVEQASTVDLLASPNHPYTVGLLDSIPRLDQQRPHRLRAIPGAPPIPGRHDEGCAFAARCLLSIHRCATDRPALLPVAGPDHLAACLLRTPDQPERDDHGR